MGRVGEVCGITEAEARKQHMKALRALRNPENSNRLRRFVPEDERVYSSALWGNGAEHFNRTWTRTRAGGAGAVMLPGNLLTR